MIKNITNPIKIIKVRETAITYLNHTLILIPEPNPNLLSIIRIKSNLSPMDLVI